MIDCLPKMKSSGRGEPFFAIKRSTKRHLRRAEALLEELRPESPLRHRLDGELTELRKMRSKKQTPQKQAPQKQTARGK